MCLLFETIKIKDGVFYNLDLHSERMNNARKTLFNANNKIDLSKVLNLSDNYKKGLYKYRVEYNKDIIKTEAIPYVYRKIKTLQIVFNDEIDYTYKYANRAVFEEIRKKTMADDILIIKKGLITDTSFTNVALFNGNQWFTPFEPLLKGTKREELIRKRTILEKKLIFSEIKQYKKIRLINSMLNFDDQVDVEINNVLFNGKV